MVKAAWFVLCVGQGSCGSHAPSDHWCFMPHEEFGSGQAIIPWRGPFFGRASPLSQSPFLSRPGPQVYPFLNPERKEVCDEKRESPKKERCLGEPAGD